MTPLVFVSTNGLQMAVQVAEPVVPLPDRPAVLLLHGFPELAHSWRHQMHALAAAGYRAIAPDLRGYGDTGAHGEVADYRMANLAQDVLGLLDALGIAKAVVVGHDFGGALAWTLARDHADRLHGVVSLCTPYTRRTDTDLAETMRRTRGPDNYMVFFQTPGAGEALLTANLDTLFDRLMRRPAMSIDEFNQRSVHARALPADLFLGVPELMGERFLDEAAIAHYTQAFRRTGFTGPLNWYRNLPRNWADTEGRPDQVTVPALMLCADRDCFLPPSTTRGMEHIVPDLERHTVSDCGHWMQQERPEAVNRLLLDWLQRRMPTSDR